MKTAVVGCGNISGCHFGALEKIKDVTITAAADIRSERAEAAAGKYNCKAYSDYIKMLDEACPDTVHICTPHYLHADMVKEALERNINVLCEKPCAISEDGLLKIKNALKNSSAQYGVCFQNRYNESVCIVKSLLESGKYGKIVCARASVQWKRDEKYYSDDWHGKKDKEGGGVLINQSIHTLDLLRYILGENMKTVSGHIFNEKFKDAIEVEDSASARFETESGTVAVFSATVGAGCNHPVMLEFVCENGVLRIEGDNAYCIKDGNIEKLSSEKNFEFIGKNYWGNGHEALIFDFYDSLKKGKSFPIGFDEAEKSVRELIAVYLSAERNERVKIEY